MKRCQLLEHGFELATKATQDDTRKKGFALGDIAVIYIKGDDVHLGRSHYIRPSRSPSVGSVCVVVLVEKES